MMWEKVIGTVSDGLPTTKIMVYLRDSNIPGMAFPK
jgi:hypothetical protein